MPPVSVRRPMLLSPTNPSLLATILLLSAVLFAPSLEANTVASLSRSHDSSGRSMVILVCSEPINARSFRTFPLADPPRLVVALEGITTAVDPAELWIGDGRVEKIRLIHHSDRVPPELLVVLDLTDERAQILELRHETERLVIVVGTNPASTPGASSPTPKKPSPSPTPETLAETATPPPTVTRTPASESTSTVTPTPTPEPSPTATPTQTPTPTPTSSPTSTPTETPSSQPTATVKAEATSIPAPVPPVGLDSLPTPKPTGGDGSRLEKISASNRGDGSTLLRISAGGVLPLGCARNMVVDGDPPRIVITMRGISAPDLPRTIEFDDDNLRRIRLIHDAETSDGELHLLLQPSRIGVEVSEMKQLGHHLVVVLGPPASPPEQ